MEWDSRDTGYFDVVDTKPTPDEEVLAQENADEILEYLTPKQKEFMKLFLFGYKRKEIFKMMGYKDRNSVDVMMYRIRRRIEEYATQTNK